MIGRPIESEYAPFYAGYVELVPETDVMAVLEAQVDELRRRAQAIPAEREQYRYTDGKWSVREIFGHMGDAERVFGYRAFCVSRGETASLPGMDEKQYVAHSPYAGCRVADLAEELVGLRHSNLAFLRRLDDRAWGQQGVANGSPVTVRALAFILAGHVRHHLNVLATRYVVVAQA